MWCEVTRTTTKANFGGIGYHEYRNWLGFYFQLAFPVRSLPFTSFFYCNGKVECFLCVIFGFCKQYLLHHLVVLFQNKYVVDQTVSLSFELAVRSEAIQGIPELLKALFILPLSREETKSVQSSFPFTSTRIVCSHWFKRTGRVIVAIWVVRNLPNKVFRAAWPFERNKKLSIFLLSASSEVPPVRAASRSPLSLRVSSYREIESLAIMATVNVSIHFPTTKVIHGARSSTDWGQPKSKQRRGPG